MIYWIGWCQLVAANGFGNPVHPVNPVQKNGGDVDAGIRDSSRSIRTRDSGRSAGGRWPSSIRCAGRQHAFVTASKLAARSRPLNRLMALISNESANSVTRQQDLALSARTLESRCK